MNNVTISFQGYHKHNNKHNGKRNHFTATINVKTRNSF